MRAAADWSRAAAWTSLRNVAEYLAHESRDLVSRPEAEHFLRGVECMREQLDRIDARLQLMEQRARTLTGGPPPP
jgi:ubiquinone biosynthesis protein UbiJ